MTKMTPRRVGGIATALGVGAIAAIASFAHIRQLAIDHGQSRTIGTMYPLTVDLLIVGATFAMDGERKFWPRVTFFTGVAATISGNILAVPGDALSRIISAWPAVALLLVVEILIPRARRVANVAAETTPAVDVNEALMVTNHQEPKPAPAKPYVAPATAKRVAAVAKRNPNAKTTEIAAKTGFSETTVRRALATTEEPPVAAELEGAPA